MQLYAVYIGGTIKGANIELHDMRFVVSEKIEDGYSDLQKQWWGTPSSLHLDCWAEISRADGYKVSLRKEPYVGNEKLYFVNLGGYEEGEFSEVHRNVFVVAETEQKAKIRALKLVRHWSTFHKDEMYDVEKAFCLNKQVRDKSLYIHLEKTDDETAPPFFCKYKPIGKKNFS